MSSTDEQSILKQLDKSPEQRLQELFDLESPWKMKGRAHIHTSFKGESGRSYGSFNSVDQEMLDQHDYDLSISSTFPYHVYVDFNDVVARAGESRPQLVKNAPAHLFPNHIR